MPGPCIAKPQRRQHGATSVNPLLNACLHEQLFRLRHSQSIHLGEVGHARAACLECFLQGFATRVFLRHGRESLFQDRLQLVIRRGEALAVIFAAQPRGLDCIHQLLDSLRARLVQRLAAAAFVQFQNRVMHVLGRHGLDRLGLEVVAGNARGQCFDVACRARVQPKRHFQLSRGQLLRVCRHKLLKNAELEWEKPGTEQPRVQREQLVEEGVRRARRLASPGVGALGGRRDR